MNFSQRMGITPATKQIQIDSIDQDLRNGLWDIYCIYILDRLKTESYVYFRAGEPKSVFCNSIWHNYFKKTLDTLPYSYSSTVSEIRTYFFKCFWFELYNFIEYSIELTKESLFDYVMDQGSLTNNFNRILEREFAGYRIIEGKIAPIINPTEIAEIEESFSLTENFTSLNGCNIHLKEALSKLSDKVNPDYRNSIKESVSAVESLAKIISNNANDSLGASLDKIKGKLKIHSALEQGFKKIYGYTSDAEGIRHALTEESTCDFEDAKFMLVSCSAFINYLIMKAKKAEITFE